MTRSLIVGSILALVACGPTPPDYDALARHSVEACGEVFRADDLVRQAYEGEPTGSLPTSVAAPSGTVAVSYMKEVDEEKLRYYPCAEDEERARALLRELGYRSPVLSEEEDHFLVYEAIDPYGIASSYSVFLCDFVGEVLGRRTGSLYHQGLFGAFGENGGEALGDDLLRKLASITFATGMTRLANEGYPRFVEGITLIGSEQEVTEVSHPGNDDLAGGIGVCATWVEPNLWGGCDAVRVGMSRTVILDREAGDFHQVPIYSVLEGFYGFAGWCGRRE